MTIMTGTMVDMDGAGVTGGEPLQHRLITITLLYTPLVIGVGVVVVVVVEVIVVVMVEVVDMVIITVLRRIRITVLHRIRISRQHLRIMVTHHTILLLLLLPLRRIPLAEIHHIITVNNLLYVYMLYILYIG